ncbi:MAG TPA: hypothetical protein VK911_15200, partial [Vicinamibacterales bacterium]|nr:hypothetical protein [Vicinamibacterales bacterium]
ERKGAGVEAVQDFELLHDMRHFLEWRVGGAILLAEANVPPDESVNYFGERGERLQCMLNFPVNQRLFYAMATADIGPLVWAIEQTAATHESAQWVQFLRSHDELDLGRLNDAQREATFAAFAPEPHMQLYHRGIRRRLAPMLGNDRRRLELAFSLLFTLPGTPMLQYGDEIGIGDDLSLPEREAARTPMQWTSERHGGFSRGEEVVRPVIDDEEYGYRKLNVADLRREPNSLLNWVERRIRMRKECPEIGWGKVEVLRVDAPGVLVLRYRYRGTSLVTLHNFADSPRRVDLPIDTQGPNRLVNLFQEKHSEADEAGVHHIELPPYGYQWLRVGAVDNALIRDAE